MKLESITTIHARIGWQNLRTSEFLDSGEYMLITGTDFKNGEIDYSNIHYVEQERYEQDKKIQIEDGSILITKDGTLGKVAYVKKLPAPATLNAGVFNVKVNKNVEVNQKYLFHYLYAPFLLKFASEQSTGGTIKHLNQNVLVKFPVPLTSFEEQSKISNFLTKFDQAITLQQRKHDLLKKLKQGYLQQMFPDKDLTTPRLRFSEFNGDWKQCEFTDLSKEIYGGGTPKTTNRSFWSGTLPWIQSSDIDLNDFYSINSSKYVSKEGLKNSSAKRIPENSITIVTRVGVGKLAYVPFEFSTSQDFISLSKLSVNPKFAIYLLYKLLVNLSRNSQGTSIKGITRNELFSKKFLIPTSKYEQAKIGEYLKMIDSLITLQQSKIKNLNTLKQAYLQKLFP